MTLELKSKIWIEKEGSKVFGDGPWDILQRVERTGSLRQAAAEINMSYSQAWKLIRLLERSLGFSLLEKKAGGSGGGHSSLTAEAALITAAYSAFRHEASAALDTLFSQHLKAVLHTRDWRD